MKSLIEEFKDRGIIITFKYYGIHDFATTMEIKQIYDNAPFFETLYNNYPLTQINSMDNYYNYLLTQKFIKMEEVIPYLFSEEGKILFKKLISNAKTVIDQIDNKEVINFINLSYKDIFQQNKKDHFTKDLIRVSFDYVILFRTGVSIDVFEHICENFGYIIVLRYDEFEKTLENDPSLFLKVFKSANLEKLQCLNFSCTLDVFAHIWKKKNSNLKSELEPIIQLLSDDIEKLANDISADNVIYNEYIIRQFFDFLKQINHINANKFEGIYNNISKLQSESLKMHGQTFTIEIPMDKRNKMLNSDLSILEKIFLITHKINSETKKWESLLNEPPIQSDSIIDLVSTNIATDSYFTLSHQKNLDMIVSIGSASIMTVLYNTKLYNEFMPEYTQQISLLSNKFCNSTNDLLLDFGIMLQMLNNIFECPKEDQLITQSLCYGAAMYICAFTEKLLRVVYRTLLKDEIYIPPNKSTLGELLDERREIFVKIFGEYQIKHLRFYFCGEKGSDVGYGYRNKLAHWNQIYPQDITPLLVCKLFYLLSSLINSICCYFADLDEIESEDNNEKRINNR